MRLSREVEGFWEERRGTVRSDAEHPYSAGASPAAKRSFGKGEPGGVASASVGGGNAAFEVSMIPEDYKRLSPEIISKIKPLTDEPETSDPEQLAARRYLADMGISLKTAVDARIGCLTKPRVCTAVSAARTVRAERVKRMKRTLWE